MTHEQSIKKAEEQMQAKFEHYLIMAWDELEQFEFTVTEMSAQHLFSVVHHLADQLAEAMSISSKQALLIIYNNVEAGIDKLDDKSNLN